MGGRERKLRKKRIHMRGLIWIGLSGGNYEEKREEQEFCYKRDLMRESIGLEEEKKMRRMGEKNEDYWKENEEEWAANEETSEERERRERDRWVSYKRANATCHPSPPPPPGWAGGGGAGGGEGGGGGVRQAAGSPSLGRHASCNSEGGEGRLFSSVACPPDFYNPVLPTLQHCYF